MVADLSTLARQALIILMIRGEKAANPDLRQRYRSEITKPAREELVRHGLVSWEKGPRNSILLELTDKGWVRAREEFRSVPPEKVSGAWLLHYATLRHLASLLDNSDLRIADIYAAPDPGPGTTPDPGPVPVERPVEDRVRDAYRDLAETPGDLIRLADVRQRLTDVDRADQDRALLEMDRRREIHLDPDPARTDLTQDDHDAAVLIGGEAKHLITIGRT